MEEKPFPYEVFTLEELEALLAVAALEVERLTEAGLENSYQAQAARSLADKIRRNIEMKIKAN